MTRPFYVGYVDAKMVDDAGITGLKDIDKLKYKVVKFSTFKHAQTCISGFAMGKMLLYRLFQDPIAAMQCEKFALTLSDATEEDFVGDAGFSLMPISIRTKNVDFLLIILAQVDNETMIVDDIVDVPETLTSTETVEFVANALGIS